MSTLPSPCIRGDKYLLTKCSLVTDFVRTYVNPLVTVAAGTMGTGTVIWQMHKTVVVPCLRLVAVLFYWRLFLGKF